MKKQLFACLAVAALLSACGGRTGASSQGEATAEGQPVAAEKGQQKVEDIDPQSEEALMIQVKDYYAEMNRMAAEDDVIDIARLDRQFCSKSLLALMAQVDEANQKVDGPEGYFSDEGYHWLQGLDTPVEVDINEVYFEEIEKKKYAEVYLALKNNGSTSKLRLRTVFEDGAWKINDFVEYDCDTCSLRNDMDAFLGNPIP